MSAGRLVDAVLEGIKAALAPEAEAPVIVVDGASQGDASEFLFFIKPELTSIARSQTALDLLSLIISKMAEFCLEPFAIRALPSGYLRRHRLIERHYGVINAIAQNPRAALTASSRAAFEQIYGVPLERANVLGGFEFLARFPDFTPSALDALWMEAKSTKLGGGTYCRVVEVRGETVHLINGFHPSQIEHYTAPSRCIAVFALRGQLPWSTARNDFVGATDPGRARLSSLRGTFLARAAALGIGEISQAMNGVHLSAGPVEGLVELGRYLLPPALQDSPPAWIDRFSFGRALLSALTPEEISAILANATVPYAESTLSIFELTEEKDPREAIALLEAVRSSLQRVPA